MSNSNEFFERKEAADDLRCMKAPLKFEEFRKQLLEKEEIDLDYFLASFILISNKKFPYKDYWYSLLGFAVEKGFYDVAKFLFDHQEELDINPYVTKWKITDGQEAMVIGFKSFLLEKKSSEAKALFDYVNMMESNNTYAGHKGIN